MGAQEVKIFLTHLAVVGKVAASTQNQARSALLFLYQEVLNRELPWLDEVEHAKGPRRLPVALTPAEVRGLLDRLAGIHWLIASLLYGTGMRLMEGLRLRVKDIDFEQREIVIRDGKGFKDRVTLLPALLSKPLITHLTKVKAYMKKTCGPVTVSFICLTRLNENTRMLIGSGASNMFFLRLNYRQIPAPG